VIQQIVHGEVSDTTKRGCRCGALYSSVMYRESTREENDARQGSKYRSSFEPLSQKVAASAAHGLNQPAGRNTPQPDVMKVW
jgi:hypothetical protein